MSENKSIFETLFEINVNEHVEKKQNLSYLSWPYAWAEVKKIFQTPIIRFIYLGESNFPMSLMKVLDIWFLPMLQLKT